MPYLESVITICLGVALTYVMNKLIKELNFCSKLATSYESRLTNVESSVSIHSERICSLANLMENIILTSDLNSDKSTTLLNLTNNLLLECNAHSKISRHND